MRFDLLSMALCAAVQAAPIIPSNDLGLKPRDQTVDGVFPSDVDLTPLDADSEIQHDLGLKERDYTVDGIFPSDVDLTPLDADSEIQHDLGLKQRDYTVDGIFPSDVDLTPLDADSEIQHDLGLKQRDDNKTTDAIEGLGPDLSSVFIRSVELPDNEQTNTPTGTPSSHLSHIARREIGSAQEDEKLYKILEHVEQILDGGASSAKEQIQWIQDAIVHPTESLREEADHILTSDQILENIRQIMDAEVEEGEGVSLARVSAIFNEIAEHSNLGRESDGEERMPDDPQEEVLYRIRRELYGGNSAQKAIQKILNHLADHLHPQPAEKATFAVEQETLGGEMEDVAERAGDEDGDVSSAL